MIIPTDSILSIIKFLQEVKLAREGQNVQVKRINLAISTLSEPLKQSMDFYFSSGQQNKEQNTLTNFQQALQYSKDEIVKIQKKSCIFRYFSAQNDLEILKGCYDLISDAIKLVQAEKDILQLSQIKLELSKKQSQMNSIKAKVTDEKAQSFWKDFIGIEKMEAPVYDLVNKLYQVEFENLENKDQKDKIKKQYATQKLLKQLDLDGSGFVDLEELNKFYTEIWNIPANRENLINEILEEQDKPLLNKSQIMVSILEECGLGQLITKFHSLNIDSKIFLQLDQNSLNQITSLESAVKIYQAIQNHHNQIQDFKQIRTFLLQIRPETQFLLQEYNKNPQVWKEGFTGICKIHIKDFDGHIVIQSVNGICRGTFIHLNESYRYVTWFGYILYFDPTIQKAPVQYYESFCYKPSKYLLNNNNILDFQYNTGKQCFTVSQYDPFNISLSSKISLRDKENGSCITSDHGPAIKIDEKGNQVRLYYSYGEEVTYQQYIEEQDNKYSNKYYEIAHLEYAKDEDD